MTGMILKGVVFGVFGDQSGRLTSLIGWLVGLCKDSWQDLVSLENLAVASPLYPKLCRKKERRGCSTALVTTIEIIGAGMGGITAKMVS